MRQSLTDPTSQPNASNTGHSPRQAKADPASVHTFIRRVDRVLHPDQQPPFVMTCGGLSRLRETQH